MKERIFQHNRTFLVFWLAFHGFAAFLFVAFLFRSSGKIQIDADLFNMLPKPILSEALSAADDKLTEITGQNVFILVSNPSFESAKKTAETVYEKLSVSSGFKSLSLYQDMSVLGSVTDYIHRYRWNLLDEQALEKLNQIDGAKVFSENALARAFGAFTVSSLENLDKDPFLLGEYNLQHYLTTLQDSGTKMSLKDGVLASFANERWYVMIRGSLTKEGAALASKTNAVIKIHEVCDALEKDDTRFIYSGTPFHSYKSSSNASKEIALISIISLIVVFIILSVVFRRPQPILYSIASIFIATLTSVAVTLSVFGKIHVLTLVFGTSLIGSCIDYSLHYFVNWKANTDFSTGKDIRKYLLTGLSLSLVSTELCYLILIFAPFNLLKQMAVFSMSGILSSFFTVLSIYPYIRLPKSDRRILLVKFMKMPSWYNKKIVGRCVITALFILSLGSLFVFRKNVKIENKVNKLYKAEGRELENEAEASKILQYSPSGWFIVSGATIEETLQNEEALTAAVKKLNKNASFICTTKFIPSILMQKKSRAMSSKLLPFASAQYEALGYPASLAYGLERDFYSGEDDFVIPGKNVPQFLQTSISSVWIGEIKGRYYSVVLPVRIKDKSAYRTIADGMNDIYFISKIEDMNSDLDSLSRIIMRLFILVYFVLFIVLKFFYSWKQTLKITSIPLLIVLCTTAIFAAANIPLEFFSITGMILVFGLGLDYVIYMIENERRHNNSENAKLEPFAIALSFFTTAVSFGALSLSKFIPVHMMGFSIFIGISVSFISTFFYIRADYHTNKELDEKVNKSAK